MDEHGEHRDLCGSGCWSIIPYVHGRGVCYITILAQVWVELAQKSLRILTSVSPFIA
jgi:hypothetical protein